MALTPGQTPNCSPYHAVQNSTRIGLHEQHDREITACCSPTKKRPHLPICATKMPHTIPTAVVFTTNNPRLEQPTPEHCGCHNHRHFRAKGLETDYIGVFVVVVVVVVCLFVYLFLFCLFVVVVFFWGGGCLLVFVFLFFFALSADLPFKSDRIINLLIAVVLTEEEEEGETLLCSRHGLSRLRQRCSLGY